MYSIFDLLFDAPSYRSVYVISDSQMKKLQSTKHQEELDEIINQKKRLQESYEVQVKHLEDREKELKAEIRSIEGTK